MLPKEILQTITYGEPNGLVRLPLGKDSMGEWKSVQKRKPFLFFEIRWLTSGVSFIIVHLQRNNHSRLSNTKYRMHMGLTTLCIAFMLLSVASAQRILFLCFFSIPDCGFYRILSTRVRWIWGKLLQYDMYAWIFFLSEKSQTLYFLSS